MPYLICKMDGGQHKEGLSQRYEVEIGSERLLVVNGRLIGGPWRCEKCNAELKTGDFATLVYAIPSHSGHGFYDYDLERRYFDMTNNDQAAV